MDERSSWNQILMSLAIASGQSPATLRMSPPAPVRPDPRSARDLPERTNWVPNRTSIKAIEPHGKNSLLVSWCDPTSCHYIDQVWVNVTARKNGCCALTGLPIQCGDLIYKPQCRGSRAPANRHEMILLSALSARSHEIGLLDNGHAFCHP
ncbi:DUF3331 domain-containing protein [Burkholderia sp. Ac-20344]|nr:DUF3331 domain-containing protein [Burkholderia sp. Ac-20344]